MADDAPPLSSTRSRRFIPYERGISYSEAERPHPRPALAIGARVLAELTLTIAIRVHPALLDD